MLPASPSFEHNALSRVTFGARDVEVAQVQQTGWSAWVDDQLNPPAEEEVITAYLKARSMHIKYAVQLPAGNSPGWPAVDERRGLNYLFSDLASIWRMVAKTEISIAPNERTRIQQELNAATWIRNAHSKYQLREFLTDFWGNHFNIGREEDIYGAASLVDYDANVIRPRVFGNFRDLLEAVASSASMLRYLNNAASGPSQPTENYAREIMELHTLGAAAYLGVGGAAPPPSLQVAGFNVASGFTDADVVQVARAFSGWTVEQGQDGLTGLLPFTGKFIFNPLQHGGGAGAFLGVDLSRFTGVAQGRVILDMLAAHPATADFVVGKLARRIFGDSPPQNVVARAKVAWITNASRPDQIKRVVAEFLASPEIGQPASKVRRPYERLIALLRTTDTIVSAYDGANDALAQIGDGLYAWPTPDGRPDNDAYWLNRSSNLQFWNQMFKIMAHPAFLTTLINQTPAGITNSATQIIEYWVGRLVGYPLRPEGMQALVDDALAPFGVVAAYGSRGLTNIENALRRLVILIASSPEFSIR
ncbi:MAG: DUF1800 domain-containing protein [Rhodospirillaceae bacterium]|nr:DUF1800 domain-containing protein [Rhodospirillaceae bacterium]